MAGKTVRGIAYMCPASCSRYEDATGFDYSREPEVTPPAGDGQAGTIVAFLLAKRPGTTFNPETGIFEAPKNARGVAYLHESSDAFECSENYALNWGRSDQSAVTVSYRAPKDCNWKGTRLRPAVPPDLSPGPASFPSWTWDVERTYPNGYIVLPDAGEEETREKAYYPLGESVNKAFWHIFCAPGTYVGAMERLAVSGGGIRERLLTRQFATPNITGGRIVSRDGDLDYTVEIFGQEFQIKASDYREWSPGDWVFIMPDLCSQAEHPGTSECLGDRDDMKLFGPEDIFDPEGVSLIIVPLQLGALGPSFPVSIVGQAEWGAFLGACIMRASIIEVSSVYPRADIEIEGAGRVNDVPIKYIGRGQTTDAESQRFFGPDQEVLVFNKSGKQEPSAHEIVIFHACKPVMPVLYFYSDRTKQAFLWDTETNDFPVGVTNGSGIPITSWPVNWQDLEAWMTANLEQKSTSNTILWDYPREDYCEGGEPCVADSFNLGPGPYQNPTTQAVDDMCAGPHPRHQTCDWRDNHGTRRSDYPEQPAGYYYLPAAITVTFDCNGSIAFGNRYRVGWKEDLSLYEDFVMAGYGAVSGNGNHHCFEGGTDPLGEHDDIVMTDDHFQERTESASINVTAPGGLSNLSGDWRRHTIEHGQVMWYLIGDNPDAQYTGKFSRTLDDTADNINHQILCSGLSGLGWNDWAKLLIWATFDSGVVTGSEEIDRRPDAVNFNVQCLQGDVTEGVAFENLNPFTMPLNPELASAVKNLMLDPEGEYLSEEKIGGPYGGALIGGIRICMPGTGGLFTMPAVTLYDWK